MASCTQICTLEFVNVFIHQRLTAIAGEICQLFQDTLKTFQEEIHQSKQENKHLKKLLAEINYDGGGGGDEGGGGGDIQSSNSVPAERRNNQSSPSSLDSATSVIQVKLELSTMQQGLEPADRSCPSPPCSPVHAARAEEVRPDTSGLAGSLRSQGDQSPTEQNSNQKLEPQNSSPSQDQVKSEESSKENAESHAPAHRAALSRRNFKQEQTVNMFSVKTQTFLDRRRDGPVVDPTVQNKPQILNSLHSPLKMNESEIQITVKEEPVSSPSSHNKPSLADFSHLVSRAQVHAVHRTLHCDVCRKPFGNELLLAKHMVIHQSRNSNCCILCGKCYSTPHVLKIHLRTHTGERPYRCRFCDKTFSQKGHLKGHERMHTGEKIYSCSVCGTAFTWMSQAKEHLRCHPEQIGRVLRKMSK